MSLYFEQCWAILSTIGVANVLYGLVVISITKYTPVVWIPIIVSISCAIANGLCYYAFYADYPVKNKAIASGFADFFWLIQEVGISFYGYAILIRLLNRQSRAAFQTIFWAIALAVAAIRAAILVGRIKITLVPDSDFSKIVNYLHVGYFTLIALLECISAYFLLREFSSARRASKDAALSGSLLQHLMRGTETRVASLALVGISRAIAYIFNQSLPQALSTAGQVDRFFYTLECLFPMMIYIDILACKIKFSDHCSVEMPQMGSAQSAEGLWDGIRTANQHTTRRPASASTSTLAEQHLVKKTPNMTTTFNFSRNVTRKQPVEFTMYDDSSSVHGVSYNTTPSLS
ncbi:hypothetical protein E8E14_001364 [Neopestalotiopsis sp. 37M]|nr:hypothetical protein E8E14_001364 [Neopestalotiopsis sp. 37M]